MEVVMLSDAGLWSPLKLREALSLSPPSMSTHIESFSISSSSRNNPTLSSTMSHYTAVDPFFSIGSSWCQRQEWGTKADNFPESLHDVELAVTKVCSSLSFN